MYVSLCGPHSFETSTFAPDATDVVEPAAVISPFLTRYWYFSHQVGSFELLVWANAAGMASAIARVRQSLRMGGRSFRGRIISAEKLYPQITQIKEINSTRCRANAGDPDPPSLARRRCFRRESRASTHARTRPGSR